MTLFKREWQLIAANPSIYFAPFLFYVMMLTLLPVFMGLHQAEQKHFVSELVWFALGLSFIALLPHIYAEDRRIGILDQLFVAQGEFHSYITAKGLAIWCAVFVPMTCLMPLLHVMYGFSLFETTLLMVATLAGGVIMTALGLLLMIIAIGLETQQAILSIMYLPLMVPVIILGMMTLDPFAYSVSIKLLLGGALLLIAAIVPCCNYVMRVMLYE